MVCAWRADAIKNGQCVVISNYISNWTGKKFSQHRMCHMYRDSVISFFGVVGSSRNSLTVYPTNRSICLYRLVDGKIGLNTILFNTDGLPNQVLILEHI